MTNPHQILQQYWGFSSFRPMQEAIINSVLNGRDTVALLPTGGGKSICFQIPALAMEGICIVVSPLVALITDQVASLQARGIKAIALTGGITTQELVSLLDNALFGNYKFLYLSPERLQQELVQDAIKKMQVNLIAVDEAHCISQWGNDFRPAYKNIVQLKELQPYAPCIALTATATPEVLIDTIAALELEDPGIFKSSFARNNLSYRVVQESNKFSFLINSLKGKNENAIIYVRNRRQTEQIAHRLHTEGITANYFHGGLSAKEKEKHLSQWKAGQTPVMVATNAFGMGIDHDSVKQVIHIQLPNTLESYFQEAGRAGRDGQQAVATLVFDENDIIYLKKLFIDNLPTVKTAKAIYRKLNNYFQISYGEGHFTEHNFSLADFSKTYQYTPYTVLSNLQLLDRLGVIQLSKQFGRKSKLRFLVNSETLLNRFEKKIAFSIVGKTVLRMYGGLFETGRDIDLTWVATKSGIPLQKIIDTLEEMAHEGLTDFHLFHTDTTLTFLVPREDDKTLNPFSKLIIAHNEVKEKQVQAVLEYIHNSKECRSLQLLRYFGEESNTPCEICSVCLETERNGTGKAQKKLSEKIELLLREQTMDSRALVTMLHDYTKEDILTNIQWLLARGRIKLNATNQYYCNT